MSRQPQQILPWSSEAKISEKSCRGTPRNLIDFMTSWYAIRRGSGFYLCASNDKSKLPFYWSLLAKNVQNNKLKKLLSHYNKCTGFSANWFCSIHLNAYAQWYFLADSLLYCRLQRSWYLISFKDSHTFSLYIQDYMDSDLHNFLKVIFRCKWKNKNRL